MDRSSLPRWTEKMKLSAQIMDFCRRIVPNYQDISHKLMRLHPEWTTRDLAGNLMEFGRGQVSGIEDPSEHDFQFMTKYIGALNLENPEIALFTAYAGGCIMGLVQSKQLIETEFTTALKVSAYFAQSEFRNID